jgi:hypothetical protein
MRPIIAFSSPSGPPLHCSIICHTGENPLQWFSGPRVVHVDGVSVNQSMQKDVLMLVKVNNLYDNIDKLSEQCYHNICIMVAMDLMGL